MGTFAPWHTRRSLNGLEAECRVLPDALPLRRFIWSHLPFGATMTTEAEASVVEPESQSNGVESNQPAGQPAGTLLSVNVGLPKDVSWQGRTVFTGVFKEPVPGSCRVRRLNVDGDGQGDLSGHGG